MTSRGWQTFEFLNRKVINKSPKSLSLLVKPPILRCCCWELFHSVFAFLNFRLTFFFLFISSSLFCFSPLSTRWMTRHNWQKRSTQRSFDVNTTMMLLMFWLVSVFLPLVFSRFYSLSQVGRSRHRQLCMLRLSEMLARSGVRRASTSHDLIIVQMNGNFHQIAAGIEHYRHQNGTRCLAASELWGADFRASSTQWAKIYWIHDRCDGLENDL